MRKVSQHAVDQHRLAHDLRACRQHPKIDAFAPRPSVELSREPLQNRSETDRLRLNPADMLVYPQGIQQLFQYFCQLLTGLLAASQVPPFGSSGDTLGQQLVRGNDSLQRLTQ